jgi:hypothetical protein
MAAVRLRAVPQRRPVMPAPTLPRQGKLMTPTAEPALRPHGLTLCWSPKPDAPARCCTHQMGHEGDHYHEYSDVTWPQDPTAT